MVDGDSVHTISKVGVVVLVMSSVANTPLSDPACKSGACSGVAGGVSSTSIIVIVTVAVSVSVPSEICTARAYEVVVS